MALAGVYLAYRFVKDPAAPFTSMQAAIDWLEVEGYDEFSGAWIDRAAFDDPANFEQVWPKTRHNEETDDAG